jgi:hypothetical protein
MTKTYRNRRELQITAVLYVTAFERNRSVSEKKKKKKSHRVGFKLKLSLTKFRSGSI